MPNCRNTLVRYFRVVLVLGCAAVLWLASSRFVRAQADVNVAGVVVTKLSLGFGGIGRVGNWLPVSVSVSGISPSTTVSLVVSASDVKGDQCESIVATGQSDSAGTLRIQGVFIAGRQDGIIRVRLDAADGRVLSEHSVSCIAHSVDSARTSSSSDVTSKLQDTSPNITSQLTLLRHESLCLLTIGTPAGLSELTADLATSKVTRESLTVLPLSSMLDLPDDRRGLDSVDVLLLVSDYGLSPLQTQAVQDWVMTGGHLLVSCGERLPQLLSSSAGPWLQQQFGIASELISSRELSSLQTFVAGAGVLQTNREVVKIVRMASDQSRVVVNAINGPLIARRSIGAGIVTMVAVDLNAKPVNRWLSLPQLYEVLLFEGQLDKGDVQSARGGRISSSGVSDLSTQLAAVSDAIPPGDRWSSWQAMLLMLVYLAVIGPLDYVLVVRLLRKPKLTWITFPLLVACACLLTFWSGVSHRAEATVRQVHLLDVASDGSRQTLRMRSWNSLSTTDSRFAEVAIRTVPLSSGSDAVNRSSSLTWHGRAEDVFGGLYRAGGAGLGRQVSRRTEVGESVFTTVPLIVDGSHAFLAESFDSAATETVFDSKLSLPASGLLEGTFTHHLQVPVVTWVIVFGNRVYLPSVTADEKSRRIEPGQPWSRHAPGVRVSELKDFLRGVRLVESSPKRGDVSRSTTTQVQTAYNSQGSNPLDILLMISTYQATGGATYVRLSNDYLRRDEISDSLHLNTALLIGLADLPLANLELDHQPVTPVRTQTVVRFFLPVQRSVTTDGSQQASTKPEATSEPE